MRLTAASELQPETLVPRGDALLGMAVDPKVPRLIETLHAMFCAGDRG
jgi:hypothetical protein